MKEYVPIVTANFNPLRFVLRGESDSWAPSLEEINGRSYDYVKLHRLSTCFDVGIVPFSLGVCFDGTLVLPLGQKFRDRSRALAQFNVTLTELLVGGIYCEAVAPDDIGYGRLSLDAYARVDGGGAGPSASFHRAARSRNVGALDAIRLFRPETVTTDELHESLAAGRLLLRKLGDIPREQVLYGTTFYVRKLWAESLIHIWTVTERIVELAWQRYVVEATGVSSKRRRAFLDDHKSWPVSTKLEVLLQKNLLTPETYETLDKVRKARNDFAHRGVVPGYETATAALGGCFELASLCASDFGHSDLFQLLVSLVKARCKPELLPERATIDISNATHWLMLPPLPGDENWGDKKYEVVDELCLKPLAKGASPGGRRKFSLK